MSRRVCQEAPLVCLPKVAGVLFSIISLGFALPAAKGETRAQSHPKTNARPELIFVETPVFDSGATVGRFPQGSRIMRLPANAKEPMNLTAEFYAAADPQVSFDGMRVLFSGETSAGEKWQIWEMNADGSSKRQITNCPEDCLRAAYLPGDEIAFTVVSEQHGQRVSYLSVMNSNGTGVQRITFGPGEFWLETVLRDGRILASGSWPLSRNHGAANSRLLYTLRPDGSALDSFRCEHKALEARADAEELEDRSIIFVKDRGAQHENGGELTEIRRGAPGEAPIGKPAGSYLSPRQISADKLIVSRSVPSGKSANQKFNLYVFDLNQETVGELVYSDKELSSLQAVSVVAHERPKRFLSTLNLESSAGYFISLDSYVNGDHRITPPIARVRVVALEAGNEKERRLGEAPVEKDGSFYVQVAANQAVRFELLDESGKTIVAERSWIWARPGEQRGCPGCHGDKALAPENRWPMTLKRFDTPTQLGEKENVAAVKAAN